MGNSNFITIDGVKIHYIEEGEGDPILFLHGIAVSSYVWRNIIPILSDRGRCIAIDLVGMGKSDKPHMQYSISEHIKFLEKFINALNLHRVTLVLHGFGAIIGLDYAMHHENDVTGIAFYEAQVNPLPSFEKFSLPLQNLLYKLKNNLEKSFKTILEDSTLLQKFLSINAFGSLKSTEIETYTQPFTKSEDRNSLLQYIKEFLSFDSSSGLGKTIADYSKMLQKSVVPKLMLYATPGLVTTMEMVDWCKNNLPNLETADLEEGMHLAQESNPLLFGQLLRDWHKKIVAI